MIKKVRNIVYRLMDFNFYACLYKRVKLKRSQKKYGFDEWHCNAPYECRPYKSQLVMEINKLNDIDITVEIGGGLGEIISKIHTNKKYLFDIDENLKGAVNELYSDVIFMQGSFNQVFNIDENRIDCLILVNWIHSIEKKIIVDFINSISRKKNLKYIILDEINDNIAGYKNKHKFNDLEHFSLIKLIDDSEGIRKFRVLKCRNI